MRKSDYFFTLQSEEEIKNPVKESPSSRAFQNQQSPVFSFLRNIEPISDEKQAITEQEVGLNNSWEQKRLQKIEFPKKGNVDEGISASGHCGIYGPKESQISFGGKVNLTKLISFKSPDRETINSLNKTSS